jgi:hypothetical protein
MSPRSVDWVHDAPVHETSLNGGHRLNDL